MSAKKDLLILDSSKMVRTIFASLLENTEDIGEIYYPKDAFDAMDVAAKLNEFITTVDIENDSIDGIYFLEQQIKAGNRSAIVVSPNTPKAAFKSVRALEMGALSCISRPCDIDGFRDLDNLKLELKQAIKNAGNTNSQANISIINEPLSFVPTDKSKRSIVAIGAAEGGVRAIKSIVARLPKKSPAVLIAQHLPMHCAHTLADSLNGVAEMKVQVATDSEEVVSGNVYLAPGGCHMGVKVDSSGKKNILLQKIDSVVNVHCSADYLFNSLSRECAEDSIAVILTGAGNDGAVGMKKLSSAGGYTIAQSASTCAIDQMPRFAEENGGVMKCFDLADIPSAILDRF